MTLDPVTHEIIQGKLLAIADEMAIVMKRTSMSPVIYEVLDFACGICDRHGDLIAQTNGITLFTGTFSTQIRALLERFGDDLHPGDVLVSNDPYSGGTHACDLAFVKPIFSEGTLIAFAINVAHWLDVGGAVPGSLPPDASSVYQEGLRLPGVRLARNDIVSDDLVRIILENTRTPDISTGDLNAQLATLRVGARRLGELTAKYGAPTLTASFARLLADSEALSRAAIAALPDGVYSAHDIIDGDGASNAPIEVTVKVTINGETVVADFTGCPPARPGPINCARGALASAVRTIFKALVAPHEPSNEGWFRPLRVVAPDGTLFTATKPSPTGWYYEGSVHASELVWKALAPVMPKRFSAGSYTSLCALYISGEDDSGESFLHIEPEHGGWGACPQRDGTSGLIALTDGDTFNYSVELIEAKFPLLLRRYDFNVEAGVGAGCYRGGFGLVREYQICAARAEVHCGFGRTATPPWGIMGGAAGSCNALEIVPQAGPAVRLARSPQVPLARGDIVRIQTGGGGGWGPPSQRSAEAIRNDIRDGLLTAEDAAHLYGYTMPAATEVA